MRTVLKIAAILLLALVLTNGLARSGSTKRIADEALGTTSCEITAGFYNCP